MESEWIFKCLFNKINTQGSYNNYFSFYIRCAITNNIFAKFQIHQSNLTLNYTNDKVYQSLIKKKNKKKKLLFKLHDEKFTSAIDEVLKTSLCKRKSAPPTNKISVNCEVFCRQIEQEKLFLNSKVIFYKQKTFVLTAPIQNTRSHKLSVIVITSRCNSNQL